MTPGLRCCGFRAGARDDAEDLEDDRLEELREAADLLPVGFVGRLVAPPEPDRLDPDLVEVDERVPMLARLRLPLRSNPELARVSAIFAQIKLPQPLALSLGVADADH